MATSIDIRGTEHGAQILTTEALAFVADLQRTFGRTIAELMERRARRQRALESGEERFDFLPETKHIRQGDWVCAPVPKDLRDRRVEITGPVDKKMIINALNSGARVFMADFEDSNTPTWQQRRQRAAEPLRSGASHALARHTREKIPHQREPGRAVRAAARAAPSGEAHRRRRADRARRARRLRPLLLPQRARAHLARQRARTSTCRSSRATSRRVCGTWSSCTRSASLGIPQGTIKATVLIETLPAAFEMNEILYELREHSAGLNCGRWDYIFSFIKKQSDARHGRCPIAASSRWTRASCARTRACSSRRATVAASTRWAAWPRRSRSRATRRRTKQALAKVRADKLREVKDGHDGTWVAHPGLVPVAKEIFDAHMKGENQIDERARGRARHARRSARGPRGRAHDGGPAPQRARRHPVHRGVAARAGLRAALRLDGRRGDRGDLARAGVAVAAPRRRARRQEARRRSATAPSSTKS